MLNIDKDKTIMALGLQGQIAQTRQQGTAQDQYNYSQLDDWRVILRLAPNSDYLYNAPNPGILRPLALSNGVVFPYTPQIQVQYSASYDQTELTHSNYKIFQYKSSSVDSVSVTCDFTAQDTYEANYLLAVIHFLRSVTKMFYGRDENPRNGTPPPLCYLYGLGEYQFSKHPLAITSFTYSLPNDVDYIRATTTQNAGADFSGSFSNGSVAESRITTSGVSPGGLPLPPQWVVTKTNGGPGGPSPTYVPTKMQIQFTAVPIISRMDISQNFSLRDYATGNLLLGNIRGDQSGGIW